MIFGKDFTQVVEDEMNTTFNVKESLMKIPSLRKNQPHPNLVVDPIDEASWDGLPDE